MFDEIIKESKWSESHGAEKSYLGMGIFYYGIPYSLEAANCVCLGSGAGFVPKLMLKAQQDLVKQYRIIHTNVSLIDANIGPWGLPTYENKIEGYDEIKIYQAMTDDVYERFDNIDYLHVDADHSYDQVYRDLEHYGSRMNKHKKWAITIHDTNNPSEGDHPPIGSYKAAVDWSSENGHDMVNFPVGCGTALIMPKVGL